MTPNGKALRVAQILWPAFLMAGVLEVLVFSAIDPTVLSFGGWYPEPDTVYSLAFFTFWAVIALAVAASQWMSLTPSSHPADRRAKSTRTRQRRVRQPLAQHA